MKYFFSIGFFLVYYGGVSVSYSVPFDAATFYTRLQTLMQKTDQPEEQVVNAWQTLQEEAPADGNYYYHAAWIADALHQPQQALLYLAKARQYDSMQPVIEEKYAALKKEHSKVLWSPWEAFYNTMGSASVKAVFLVLLCCWLMLLCIQQLMPKVYFPSVIHFLGLLAIVAASVYGMLPSLWKAPIAIVMDPVSLYSGPGKDNLPLVALSVGNRVKMDDDTPRVGASAKNAWVRVFWQASGGQALEIGWIPSKSLLEYTMP